MQDMKSKGVRITMISKNNIKETEAQTREVDEVVKEKFVKPQEPKIIEKPIQRVEIEKIVEKKSEPTVQARPYQSSYEREISEKIYSTPQSRRRSGGMRKSFLVFFIIAVIFGGGYYISDMLHNVSIDMVNKRQTFDLDKKAFIAAKGADASVDFELMIVSMEDYKEITLSETDDVSYKAKGEVTFFNEFSTKAQTIAKNSYISDAAGKVYLTDKAITIPGYKTVGGKIVPGEMAVTVTSFLAGSQYNNTETDYKINAYKGTAKATKMYAKLKTPITGGAEGVVYTLGDREKEIIKTNAETIFRNNLMKKVEAEVPPGYVLYNEASQFLYDTNSEEMFNQPNARVMIKGTMSSIILHKEDLSKVLINNLLPKISEKEIKEISITDVSKLKFAFTEEGRLITKDMNSIGFTLTGSIEAVWSPDLAQLKEQIKGAHKNNLVEIFKADPGIVSATAKIFPPWYSYLPEDVSKIKVNMMTQ